MTSHLSSMGHSPPVRLCLEYGQRVLKLRQVAPEWIIPASPASFPAGEAVVVVEVDGRQHRRPVTLTQGIFPDDHFIPVREEPNERSLAV